MWMGAMVRDGEFGEPRRPSSGGILPAGLAEDLKHLQKFLLIPGAKSLQSHTRCKEIQDFLPTLQVGKMVT